MKKVLLFAVVLALVCGLSLPVAALEVEFSGEFYVEGLYNSNENMLGSDASSAFYQSRLRIRPVFNITDNLSIDTRFDALEREFGRSASSADGDERNISFDRAFLSYKSPIGLFQVGRMTGGVWGTDFSDNEFDADRIKYVVPVDVGAGKVYLFGIIEKISDFDYGTTESDLDNDRYYAGAVYKTNDYTTGLLTGYFRYKKVLDIAQNFAVTAFENEYATDMANNPGNSLSYYIAQYAGELMMGGYNPNLGAPAVLGGSQSDPMNILYTRGATTTAELGYVSPYFDGKFGNLSLTAEINYVFGELEYEPSALSGYTNPTRDVSAFDGFLEGYYDIGPITLQAGYAYKQGDAGYENANDREYNSSDFNSMGYVSPGVEWAKFFILDSDTHGMNTTLGNGVGNHIGDGPLSPYAGAVDGYQMIYLGADYAISDNMTLGILAGYSKADDIPDNENGEIYDDEQGFEYDLTFTWQITDNLEYTAIGAFLDCGDYWKSRATGVVDPNIKDSVFALYHQIKVEF